MRFSERRDQELRREGFRAGMARATNLLQKRVLEDASNYLACEVSWHEEAVKEYPITRTETRPREVESGNGNTYRLVGRRLFVRWVGDSGWTALCVDVNGAEPKFLRMVADLKENPTETVEVAE